MGHEIGQWTFFPNFDEMPKYTGVLQAKNFELVRDDLAKKHLLDLAPQFVQATGRQAVLLYKEEIEILLRTPNYPGFSLLGPARLSRPGHGPDRAAGSVLGFEGFCHARAARPLLRADRAAAAIEETDVHERRDLTAAAEIAHFGPQDFAPPCREWSYPRREGLDRRRRHACRACDIPTGKLTPLGTIKAPLAKAAAPCKLTVEPLAPGHADRERMGHLGLSAEGRHLDAARRDWSSARWNDEVKSTLARGGRVLLFANANTFALAAGQVFAGLLEPGLVPHAEAQHDGHPLRSTASGPGRFSHRVLQQLAVVRTAGPFAEHHPGRHPGRVPPDRAGDRQFRAESQAGRDLRGPGRCGPIVGLRHRLAGPGGKTSRPRGSYWQVSSGMRGPRPLIRRRNCRQGYWTNLDDRLKTCPTWPQSGRSVRSPRRAWDTRATEGVANAG